MGSAGWRSGGEINGEVSRLVEDWLGGQNLAISFSHS